MENEEPAKTEKRSRNSFWLRFSGQSKKSSLRDKNQPLDITLTKAEKLYSSFRRTPARSASRASSDITRGSAEEQPLYKTLDGSAIAQVHKDAGILFLNDGVLRLGSNKEEDRHVQFAPTPLNKYYTLDPRAKSASNKENLPPNGHNRVCRSILRNRDSDDFSTRGSNPKLGEGTSEEDEESKLLKVKLMIMEAQSKQTPSFPRTSTRVALKDHQNLPLPELDESEIVRENTVEPKCRNSFKRSLCPPHSIIRPVSTVYNSSVAPAPSSTDTNGNLGNISIHPKQMVDVKLPPFLPVSACHQNYQRPMSGFFQAETTNHLSNPRRYSLGPAVSNPTVVLNQKEQYTNAEKVKNCKQFPPVMTIPTTVHKKDILIPGNQHHVQHVSDFTQTSANDQRRPPVVRGESNPLGGQLRNCELLNSGNYQQNPASNHSIQKKSSGNQQGPELSNSKPNSRQYMKKLICSENCNHYFTVSADIPAADVNDATKSYPTKNRGLAVSNAYAHAPTSAVTSTKCPVRPATDDGHFRYPQYLPWKQHPKTNIEITKTQYQPTHQITNKRGNACFAHSKNAQTEFSNKIVTSSPSNPGVKILPKSWKYDRWLKERDDCASSMADDEFSMNCSCSRCTHRFAREAQKLEHPFSRIPEEVIPAAHFFSDESKGNSNPAAGRKNMKKRYPSGDSVRKRNQSGDSGKSQNPASSSHVYETLIKKDSSKKTQFKVQKNDTMWYECEDSPHKPFIEDVSAKDPKKENLAPEFSESLYTNEGISKIIERAVKQTLEQLISMNTVPMLRTPNRTKSLENVSGDCSNFDESPVYMNLEVFRSRVEGSSKASPVLDAPKYQSPVKCSLAVPPGLKFDLNPSHLELLQKTFQKLLIDCGAFVNVPQCSQDDPKGDKLPHTTNGKETLGAEQQSASDDILERSLEKISQISLPKSPVPSTFNAKEILNHSQSLPDLGGIQVERSKLSQSNPLIHHCGDFKQVPIPIAQSNDEGTAISNKPDSSEASLSTRHSADSWESIPNTDHNSACSTLAAAVSRDNAKEIMNDSCNDLSVSTERGLAILEEAMRLGMGLAPAPKVKKSPHHVKSPTKKTKFKAKEILSGKAKLKLSIYHNAGLVTIHIMRAAKLISSRAKSLNPYVKVSLIPDDMRRAHWRTSVVKGQKSPIFDQKFSFEILPEDSNKRLIFSVWHRDTVNQRSELLGCMSFGLHHVMDDTQCINGWYRLLREAVGTQKHFAAHSKKNKLFLQNPGSGVLGIVSKSCLV